MQLLVRSLLYKMGGCPIGGPLLVQWGDQIIVGGGKTHTGKRGEDLALLVGGR